MENQQLQETAKISCKRQSSNGFSLVSMFPMLDAGGVRCYAFRKSTRNNKTHQHKRSTWSEKEARRRYGDRQSHTSTQKGRKYFISFVHLAIAVWPLLSELPRLHRVCVKRNHITSRHLFHRQPAKWFVFIIILSFSSLGPSALLWPKQLLFRNHFRRHHNNSFLSSAGPLNRQPGMAW